MTDWKQYRKKPVVVEAIQVSPMVGDRLIKEGIVFADGWGRVAVKTLEGDIMIGPDDWLVKGTQGEYYPVKPDIFEATYEESSLLPGRLDTTALRDDIIKELAQWPTYAEECKEDPSVRGDKNPLNPFVDGYVERARAILAEDKKYALVQDPDDPVNAKMIAEFQEMWSDGSRVFRMRKLVNEIAKSPPYGDGVDSPWLTKMEVKANDWIAKARTILNEEEP